MALSRIFDIAQRSLGVYQKALDVTSHNVANASNPNYSRQRVNFYSEIPEINAGMIWGSGVRIDNVERVRNQLTESQILNNNPKFSFNDKESYLLGQIESVFSEPTELGLSNLINEFFNSWGELAVTPNSVPLRNNVIYAAENLASKVDTIKESFEIVKNDIKTEFKAKVETINDTLAQIQNLNTKIFELKTTGSSPNDLMDERDTLINELSKLTNINVTYDSNNIATISMGGVFAVDGSKAVKFEFSETEGEIQLTSEFSGNVVKLTGGEMYALADVYSSKIPNYESQLNSVINTIRDEINTIHQSGYTLDEPPQSGIDFFQVSTDGKLIVNTKIKDDPYKIAVSADGTNGNGDLATLISELANKKTINNQSIVEAYSSLVSGVGNNKQAAEKMAASDSLVLEQLELQRASYSGVSIDEEMANVINFQRSYDASAKLIRVADEMLETIINMV